MRKSIPEGLENSVAGRTAPDIQAAFQVFAAHWRRVNARWRYPEHTHAMFEFNLVLEGEQRLTIDGREIVQSAGELVFIRPGVVHCSGGSVSERDMAYFCLHFDIDDPALRRTLLAMRETSVPREGSGAAIHDALARYRALSQEAQDAASGRLGYLRASLRLLAAICDWAETAGGGQAAANGLPEHARALAGAIERQLRRAADGEGGPGGRAAIERIAAQLGYSPAYCARVFQRVYGLSPRQHLSGLIVRRAKLLLNGGELTIDEIARQLGYRDASQFSKQFKRWTNLSPQSYRRLSH